MNRKLTGLRVIISMCAALGWWGLLWPELVLTPDTVTVTSEEADSISDLPESEDGCGLYRELLNADRNQITFRSRLLADFSLFWEVLHDRNGTQ